MSDYPIEELAEYPLFRKLFDLVKAIRASRQTFDIILSDDLFYQYRETLITFLLANRKYDTDSLNINSLYGVRVERMYTSEDSGPKIVLVPSNPSNSDKTPGLETYIAVRFSEQYLQRIPDTSGIYEIPLTAEEMSAENVIVGRIDTEVVDFTRDQTMQTIYKELTKKRVVQKEEEPQPPAKTPPVDIQNRKISLD